MLTEKHFWPRDWEFGDTIENFYATSVFRKCMNSRIDDGLPKDNVINFIIISFVFIFFIGLYGQ